MSHSLFHFTRSAMLGEPARLTDHAAIRLQQRGIPGWFLNLLLSHGRSRHDGHGAVRPAAGSRLAGKILFDRH